MSRRLTPLSKYLSYLLRHGADEAGLSLDAEGFAPLEEVWALVEENFGKKRYDLDDLEEILKGDSRGKKRHERVGDKIRAMYGHNRSLQQEIQYDIAEPPEALYHGTTPEAFEKIKETGLLPMQRQYVHLAIEKGLAATVASRYTSAPVMLRIKAKQAHDAGIVFFHPESSHFLAKSIPAEFIEADA